MSSMSAQAGVGSSSTVAATASRPRAVGLMSMSDTISEAVKNPRRVRLKSFSVFIIAILDFVIASIGFYLLGIKSFLLLAAIISILTFIPGLGPGVVWVPLAIFHLLIGNYLVGIGVIFIGLILGVLIETYLQGKIVEEKTKINPLIRFIGVLGGVPVFGIFGFIIGPLILIYTIKILNGAMHK